MSWRLKLLVQHSMLPQVIYRKSLHPKNIRKNRFHRSSRDILVLTIAILNLEDAQHPPCPPMPRENGKAVQTAFVKGIETYLDVIAAHMDGDEQEARQQAVALFSGLVGAIMLSRAVKKSDPALSDELLSSTQTILKPKD